MRVGCAHTIITPPPGTPLAGFGARKEGARGVHDDLYARALVLEESREQIGLVACDLCAVDAPFVAGVRSRVERATGIPPDRLMVAATHTHAAPATFPLYSLPPDPAWVDYLAAQVARTVAEAAGNLVPATLALGLGREDTVAKNRRQPDGPVDPTVTVLRADRAGAPPVLLLHYACHPTVLGPDNLLVSRDYVGFMVDAVERATGGWAMFVNGACGDINVGHSADRSALGLPIPGRTFERAEALGLRLAVEAIRASRDARPVGEPGGSELLRLAAGRRMLEVPLRHTPPLSEVSRWVRECRHRLEALQEVCAGEDDVNAARLDLMYAELALGWVAQRGQAVAEAVDVQAFAVGNVALAALPGEFFAESGLRLRARSPYPHTLVIGYANGGAGYVPPASAFAEGGYETRLASWSRLAPEVETLVIAAIQELLVALARAVPDPSI
jgi:hypothetical protein